MVPSGTTGPVCSGPRSVAPSEANLEAALTFAGGATDSDNIPSTGTGTNPIALATTTVTNDTIRITFGSGNTANANLLTPGTHTVQVTTGTNITDASAAANQANTVPAAVTISGTPAGGATRVPRPSGSSGYPAIY